MRLFQKKPKPIEPLRVCDICSAFFPSYEARNDHIVEVHKLAFDTRNGVVYYWRILTAEEAFKLASELNKRPQ